MKRLGLVGLILLVALAGGAWTPEELVLYRNQPPRAFQNYQPEGQEKALQLATSQDVQERRWAVGKLRDVFQQPEVLKALLQAAQDEDPLVRAWAITNLRFGQDGQIESLVRAALQDPDERVSWAAGRALRYCTSDLDDLLAKLLSPSTETREWAAMHLGSTKDRAVIPSLRAALLDPAQSVRAYAIDSLAGMGAGEALDEVADFLASPCDQCRLNARWAYPELFAVAFPELVAEWEAEASVEEENHYSDEEPTPEEIALALEEFEALPSPALRAALVSGAGADDWLGKEDELLTRALADPAGLVRAVSAYELSDSGTPEAKAALIGLLDDPEEQVRSASAFCIAREAFSEGLEALEKHRRDDSPEVQRRVNLALALLGQEADIRLLRQEAWSSEPAIRAEVARALGRIGRAEGLPTVSRLLDDGDPYVREQAVVALGRLGGVAALPALTAALKDEEGSVASNAAAALYQYSGHAAVPALMECARGFCYEEAARIEATLALGQLQVKESVPLLEELLWDPVCDRYAAESLGQIGGEQALQALLERARTATGELADALVRGLGSTRDPRALETLSSLATQSESHSTLTGWLWYQAPYNIALIGGPKATEALIKLLGQQDEQARAAAQLGWEGEERAIRPLLRIFRSTNDSGTKGATARALGRLGVQEVRDELLRLLREPSLPPTAYYDQQLHSAALQALGWLRAPEAEPAALEALESDSAELRAIGAFVLARLDQARGLEQLDKLLTEGDVWAAYWAGRFLGCLATPESEALLRRHLAPNPEGSTPVGLPLNYLGGKANLKALEEAGCEIYPPDVVKALFRQNSG